MEGSDDGTRLVGVDSFMSSSKEIGSFRLLASPIVPPLGTSLVIFFCMLASLFLRRYRYSSSMFAMSLHRFREKQEYWRVFTSPFVHTEWTELAFSCYSIWSIRHLEAFHGFREYLTISLVLLLVSNAMQVRIIEVLKSYSSMMEHLSRVEWSGYFGILFGWTVVQSHLPVLEEESMVRILEIIPVPQSLGPFVLFIIVQLVLLKSNVVSNVSGMIAGYLVAMGLFDWVIEPYFAFCLVQWCCVAVCVSQGFPPSAESEQVAEQRAILESIV